MGEPEPVVAEPVAPGSSAAEPAAGFGVDPGCASSARGIGSTTFTLLGSTPSAYAHFDALAPQRSLSYVITAPDTLQAEVDPDKFDRILLNLDRLMQSVTERQTIAASRAALVTPSFSTAEPSRPPRS